MRKVLCLLVTLVSVAACSLSAVTPASSPAPVTTRTAVSSPAPSSTTATSVTPARLEPSPTATPKIKVNLPRIGHQPVAAPPGDPVLIAAGDIANCAANGDEITAALLDQISGTVAALGDLAYPSGTAAQFNDCYGPSWGRHKARTRPAPGNHDYATAGAAPYYAYFGAAAGAPGKGYYSYDLGAWHIVVLNSNCSAVSGCGVDSPQYKWLVADLAAHPEACTLAYWHHPRFSSGPHGNSNTVLPFWQALYDAGADVVLNGHDHTYERFAPQTPDGALDKVRGIREFVVGSGGYNHYAFSTPVANSVIRNNSAYGVLKLTLHANSYEWAFVPEPGKTFADSGSIDCH